MVWARSLGFGRPTTRDDLRRGAHATSTPPANGFLRNAPIPIGTACRSLPGLEKCDGDTVENDLEHHTGNPSLTKQCDKGVDYFKTQRRFPPILFVADCP